MLGTLLLGVIALPAPPASAAVGDLVLGAYNSTQKYGPDFTQTLTTSGGTGSPVVVTFTVTGGPCTVGSSTGVVEMTSGTGTCTVDVSDGTDTLTATINAAKRSIVRTADPQNIVYGDPVPTYTSVASGDGFTNSEGFSPALACTSSYSPGDPVMTYTISCTGGVDTDKYVTTFNDDTLTVGKASIIVTADDKDILYGDTAPPYTYSTTGDGFYSTEDFTVDPVCSSSYAAGAAVNTYAITCVDTAVDTAKYTLTVDPGTLTVDKREIIVNATDKNVAYGAAPPTYTSTTAGDGFYASEDFTVAPVCSSSYVQGDPATTYTITCPTTAVDTAKYTLTVNDGTLTVGAIPLQVKADDKSIDYGEAAPIYTYTPTGFYGSDDFDTTPTCDSAYSQGDPAGTYTITCSGATVDPSGNYTISYATGKLTVSAIDLPTNAAFYSGPTSFQAKNKTDTSITLPLEASVDITGVSGSEFMDVEDALVTFVDTGSGKVLAKNVPVSESEPGLGQAVAWVTLPIGPTGIATYTVQVFVTGSFTGDSALESIYLGSPATTTGTIGGMGLVVPRSSYAPAGKYVTADYDGATLSVYFEVGSTKKGSTPKGQLITSWDGPDGSTYWLKSNSITAVTISNGTTATVTFKASIWQTDALGVVIPGTSDGNVVGRIDLNDTASTVGITAQSSKTSALYFSTNWVKVAGARTYSTVPVATVAGIGIPLVVN